MNRARVIKKDYQKILRALPQENPPNYNNQNRYNLYDTSIQYSPDQKIRQIYDTVDVYTEKKINSPIPRLNSLKKPKKTIPLEDKLYKPIGSEIQTKYRSNQKKTIQVQNNKRIFTLQRSIDLSQQKSFGSDRLKKKQIRPLNKKQDLNKNSPYIKKLNRHSLNMSRQKTKSHLQTSNKLIKNLNSLFRQESKIKQLKLNSKSEIKIFDKSKSEQELFTKGKDAYQNNQFSTAIQMFNIILKHSPDNIEANYLIGVSYLGKNEFLKALKFFDKVILLNDTYNKNVYILSAISLKKMSLHDQSYKKLTRCIELFPEYYDAYIYRGKINLKQKRFHQALKDFNIAISLNDKKVHGYLGRADSYLGLNEYEKSLYQYQRSIKLDSSIENTIVLKIITCLKYLNRFQQGLKKINVYLQKNSYDNEALLIRANFLSCLKQYNDANMIYQQILKLNDKKLSTKAIQQMIKIKISERDFYAAYHLIERIQFLQVDKNQILRIKMFTEAVLFLMKRKFLQSIQLFQQYNKLYKQVAQNEWIHQINYFLRPLVPLYKAYGHFCISQFQKSLQEYSKYHQILINRKKKNKILQSSYYNQTLCQALLLFQKNQFQKSISKFSEASIIFPNKIEPYFYQAVIFIRISCLSQSSQDQPLVKSLNMLSKSIQVMGEISNNIIANVLYHRSVIYAYLGIWNQSILDIDKAIEKSEDNIPKYFYLRGLIFACCQSFKQAIHDISICLSLNDAYPEAYLLRSKCLQIQGEANQAFLDLQRYITLKPQDPLIHKYAGHLLFQNGAFQDSILAYAHGEIDETRDSDIFITRGKAYFLLGEFQKCFQDMKKVYALTKNQDIRVDSESIQILILIQKDEKQSYELSIQKLTKFLQANTIEGKIFKIKQFHMLRGGSYFYLQRYAQAIQQFQKCIQLKQQIFKINDSQELDPDDIQEVYCYTNHMKLNISLCYIMLRDFKKAKQVCEKCKVEKQKTTLQLLINLLNYELNIQIDENIKKIVTQLKALQIFSLKNKLSKHFPSFKLRFNLNSAIQIKLCFSFPKVEPPEINPQFDQQLLLSLDPSNIQNKPQAPWIRRSQNCIMFTSTIQIFENLDLQTQQRTKRNELTKQYPAIQIQNEFYESESSEEIQKSKVDITKLKEKLKFEGDIEKKLNKLMKKTT